MATEKTSSPSPNRDLDVVVVGAGFAGLYLVHQLRNAGLRVLAFEAADDVGGTWYWNRYPGARCDVPTTDYAFSFDPILEKEWTWSEKYARQPEILAYLQFVADRLQLRRDIEFSTRVESARWVDELQRWELRTDHDEVVTCRYYVMASGCLSMPKAPEIPGADRFTGEVYFTSTWPHAGVDFSGKRVAVIGTGSSGIQSIPLIAEQAAQLTVFQRTPNFSIPALNGPPSPERLAAIAADRDAYRHAGRWSTGGVPSERTEIAGVTATNEERRERFEAAWGRGELFAMFGVFSDQSVSPVSNDVVAEMVREKIREKVNDPDLAETLSPRDYPFGTKRPCLDTNYFETFNRPNVRLIDLNRQPISRVTTTGIQTSDETLEFDAIVYATGFDAMTGALVAVEIEGRNGLTLKEKWSAGPSTYLGLTTVGFPNFFTVTGPGSPSVLSNMIVSIEQHVEWISSCISYADANGFTTIEPTPVAEAGWNQHVADCASITLYPQANSWYMGANVPGKPRIFLPYIGGVDRYRAACDEVVQRDYLGFQFVGPNGSQCHDGVIRRLQLDVMMMLETMALLEVPPLESLSPVDARTFMALSAAMMPPGPNVGEIVDGEFRGPAGSLAYRLYRPETPGPHAIVLYFHGGGWVLGSATSDDPLCRDLCHRSNAVIVSVDYRHGPEDRFPAAVDDALAAMHWVSENAEKLGGRDRRVVVAGWSAGGNLAAVVAQMTRDERDIELSGQLLLCPVVDFDFDRPSYQENGEDFLLTTALMNWFSNNYVAESQRKDPRAAPLLGSLTGLPPAVIMTAEFDPLRDGGIAYGDALRDAGVFVVHLSARGQTHTSFTMVDLVLSGAAVREDVADALRVLTSTVLAPPSALYGSEQC